MKRSKINEARKILAQLGMDAQGSNERSAMVFLALCDLAPDQAWSEANNDPKKIHDIIVWIDKNYNQSYAENTRETIRDDSLKRFVQGGLVEVNADDPQRPKTSPKTNYRITPAMLPVVQSYGTEDYQDKLDKFCSNINLWVAQLEATRELNQIPVTLPNGVKIERTAGGQNKLIKEIVEKFCPRFIPGGEVLYIDDAAKKDYVLEDGRLAELGIKVQQESAVPDLIVYDGAKDWVFLIEACSSNGPIDVRRKSELIKAFPEIKHKAVFVTCFPDRSVMRKYLADLAWESEAWCADAPDHMIHLNGNRFLGPYDE